MKKFSLSFIAFYAISTFSIAQDIHLSQFYTSDHLLNPAKVGDFNGDYRFIGNYRNQWRQINSDPINTYIVSFDKAFHYYSHEVDAGILVAHDEFTGFNTLTTKVMLSLGYGRVIKGHKLRFGIQPGMVFRSTNLSKQTFPDQWNYNPGGANQVGFFDPSLPNQESAIKPSENYFDLNVGAQWSKRYGKMEPKCGFALDHLTRPKDSYFTTTAQKLAMRKVFHSELNYYVSNKITIQPKLLWMWTTKANDMVFGSNLKYNIANKTIPSVFVGTYYRHGVYRNVDAVIPVAGFSYKRFDFGFSYDVNVSTLSKNVQRPKTFEFSLIYTGASSQSKYIALPCDRY